MFRIRLLSSPRRALLLALLVLGLLVNAQLTAPAFAGFVSCRTDPIVNLSDGRVLQITSTINTDPGNVRSVSYVVHGPAGTRVTNIAYTGGQFQGKETVKYYADLADASYSSDTLVATRGQAVGVTANTLATGQAVSVSGQSGDHLIANLVFVP